MTAILDKILGRRQQKEAARTVSYTELVASIAAGKTPDEATLDAVLDGANKSASDLGRDVVARQQRLQDAEMLTKEPELFAERDKLTREIDSITADYAKQKQALVERLQPQIDSRTSRRDSVTKQLAEINSARQRLVGSADPAIRERAGALRREVKVMRDRLPELQSELDGLPAAIASARESLEAAERRLTLEQNRIGLGRPAAGQSGSGVSTDDRDSELGHINKFKGQLTHLEQRKATLEVQIPSMRARVAELSREADQIDAQVFEP